MKIEVVSSRSLAEPCHREKRSDPRDDKMGVPVLFSSRRGSELAGMRRVAIDRAVQQGRATLHSPHDDLL
jgi:hypothetical protein